MEAVVKSVRRDQETLVVEAQLIDNGTVIDSRNFGFPLTATKEEIASDLAKYLESYQKDQEMAKQSAETEKANAAADATIASLEGLKVTENKE